MRKQTTLSEAEQIATDIYIFIYFYLELFIFIIVYAFSGFINCFPYSFRVIIKFFHFIAIVLEFCFIKNIIWIISIFLKFFSYG